LADELRQDPSLGYHVLHSIDRQTDGNFATCLEAFVDQNKGEPVDEVFVALPVDRYGPEVNAIVRLYEEQGIIVRIQTDLFTRNVARTRVDELNGTPVVTIHAGLPDGWQTRFKRLLDMCGSFMLLTLLTPLLACVAVLIKLDSAGPVFFRQERVGLNRRRFQLFKFRTMAQDADQQQAALEHLNEAGGPVFKIKDDPRITPLGKFLRQFSIDELPQLVNVLRGDMSLVGPRPLPIRDVERMDTHWHNRRFSTKPGLTCLWQINGRSNVNFDRWVRVDLDYIDRWSLGLDLKILMKTVPVVFKGAGAY
jgi:exopolysaccharide biosynthesis polyprenyl glycosylphosphotransferase